MAKTTSTRHTPFNLNSFFKQLNIPEPERALVADCLARGLEHYYQHIYGYNKYGRRPDFLIPERMHEPYIFGFGAVEVVRLETLSQETRLKITQYAFQQIDANAEYGTPHGLPVMISYLAGLGQLDPASFRSLMIAADFGGPLFDDWELMEVRRLFEWLIAKADIPEPERLWWLWHLCVNCESTQMCRSLAEVLLTDTKLSKAGKRALCEAWLADAPVGKPPAQWEAMQALLSGNVDAFTAHAAEAGLPVSGTLPTREAIEAEYDSALDALMADDDKAFDTPTSIHLFRKMLVGPLGLVVLTPGALKRAAISALPSLGQSPLKVCQQYLGSAREYYADTINQGVADVIRAYHHKMTGEEIKTLIERGLKVGAVPTRKTFYQLGADLLGEKFMKRAARDSAKSIREWAARKTESAPKKRRVTRV
ncbi:MAG: hypothetical protein HYZ49_13175 [Chloroflexi bacterium]|nr:hypothetical protein [Chloroflexota bacterium]